MILTPFFFKKRKLQPFSLLLLFCTLLTISFPNCLRYSEIQKGQLRVMVCLLLVLAEKHTLIASCCSCSVMLLSAVISFISRHCVVGFFMNIFGI